MKFNFDFLFSGLSPSFSKSYSNGAYILASSSDNLIPFSISYFPDWTAKIWIVYLSLEHASHFPCISKQIEYISDLSIPLRNSWTG